MLQEVGKKIKLIGTYLTRRDMYTCLTIILVAFSSFFIGALWGREVSRPPVTIKMIDMSELQPTASTVSNSLDTAPYVGNQNSKIYQLSSCLGAKLISDENKVFFATKALAEAAGYVAAKNCKM